MTKVLFVCEGNKMRSVMGEAIYNDLTDSHDAVSAGCEPYPLGGKFTETTEVLGEIGLESPTAGSKLVTQAMVDAADIVVTFPTPYMPDFVTKNPKTQHWRIVDPYYQSGDRLGHTRRVRDQIYTMVRELAEKSAS